MSRTSLFLMEIFMDYVWEKNQREKNEDAIAFRQYQNRRQICCIAVVSDGIGGMEQGEDASSFIVSEMLSAMEEFVTGEKRSRRFIRNFFMRKICRTHEKICQYGREQNLRLGATLSMVVTVQGRGYVFHTGDSSVYWGEKKLSFRTPEHRKENRLQRAVGTGDYHNPFFKVLPFRKNSGFLICSDGFNRKTEETIKELWQWSSRGKNRRFSCREIYEQAVTAGEKDNVSAVCVKRIR